MWEKGWWKGPDPSVADLTDEGEEPECRCCGSKGAPLRPYPMDRGRPSFDQALRDGRPPFRVLCPICANTMVGVYSDYPEQHDPDVLAAMKMVAYVGNLILRELRKPPAESP